MDLRASNVQKSLYIMCLVNYQNQSHITSGKAGGLKPLEPLKGAKKTKTSQLGML